jgi:hypothetical protein
MSTGLFMGVRRSYNETAQTSAMELLDAINHVLINNGAVPYIDPLKPPNVYSGHLFGRSMLDHHSSRVLAKIANLGTVSRVSPNLSLIRNNPYRVTFVPTNLDRPLLTDYSDRIGGNAIQIWVGSLPHLLAELRLLAGDLGIPLNNGELADEIAVAINNFNPLYEGDSGELAEDERTAWLALYEGTRLALEHNVALSLAG